MTKDEALAQEQWTPEDMAYRPGGLSQPEEQQSWVCLTKEEIDSALSKYQNWYEFAAHLENILKEKNTCSHC